MLGTVNGIKLPQFYCLWHADCLVLLVNKVSTTNNVREVHN